MTVPILFAPLNNALGRPLITMVSSLGGAILFPAGFLIGAEWGLIVIAWAWLVTAPLLLLLSARLTAPRLGLSLLQIARAMKPGLERALAVADGAGLSAQELRRKSGKNQTEPKELISTPDDF